MNAILASPTMIASAIALLLSAETACAAPIVARDNAYSVCDVRITRGEPTINGKSISNNLITIHADVGKSYHFGAILTDGRCDAKLVRIIFPVPDPKDIGRDFRFLDDRSRNGSVSASVNCYCTGRIHVENDILELDIDSAVLDRRP